MRQEPVFQTLRLGHHGQGWLVPQPPRLLCAQPCALVFPLFSFSLPVLSDVFRIRSWVLPRFAFK